MSSNLALDNEGFSIFVSEVQELLACITAGVKQPCEAIDVPDLQRYAHTLKGVLAVYALDAAVSATHAMEDSLQLLLQRKAALTKMDRLRLQRSTQKLGKQIVGGLKTLSTGLYKRQNKKLKTAKIIDPEPPLLLLPVPGVQGANDSLVIPTLYDRVEQPANTTMAPILKKYLDTADILARKLGKKIDIHFSGAEVPLPQKGMTLLFASVLHLIRNAVDHGIETSAKRLTSGKSERGTLRLMARQYRGMFMLCVADDGAGIDTRRIRNIAVRQGLLSKSEATRSSQEDLVNLIFVPGFSLKQQVSEISGRGIGMDAVKYSLEKHQGRIEIKTEVGKGTMMKILVPYA
jgi:chemotaxis protein histidine kinase CheA